MAVNTKSAAPTEAERQRPESAPPKKEFLLELTKIGRYMYGSQLYLKGEQYLFDEEGARHMLQLRDPQELPVFRIAKPRQRLVAVDDTTATLVRNPKPPRIDRVVMDLENFNGGKPPVPKGRIDIPDDDPDTAERLAAVDAQGAAEAGLVDTANAQTL